MVILQQWRLEAHKPMEGNGKWDVWLHNSKLELMRQNVRACFRRASLHRHSVLGSPWAGSECLLCCCRALSVAGRCCSSPAWAYETLVWTSPEALPWKCSFAVTPAAAHKMSEDPFRLSGCEVFSEGILGWGRESQSDSYLTLHRLSCITYCGILFPPTEFCSIAFRKRLLRKSFYS